MGLLDLYNIYFTLYGCYMFRLVAILRDLTTKQLKTYSSQLVRTISLISRYDERTPYGLIYCCEF